MWWIMWLVIAIACLLFEIVTPQLTSIWFTLGALVALPVSLILPDMLWLQLVVFVAVSAVAVAFTRPLAKKYINGKRKRLNADKCIGEEAIVIQEINNILGKGQVNNKGVIWTARSDNENTVIPEGQIVRIIRIEGVKVIVCKKQEEA